MSFRYLGKVRPVRPLFNFCNFFVEVVSVCSHVLVEVFHACIEVLRRFVFTIVFKNRIGAAC